MIVFLAYDVYTPPLAFLAQKQVNNGMPGSFSGLRGNSVEARSEQVAVSGQITFE